MERTCLVCGTTQNLHRHHVFFAANRKISERMNFVEYLCGRHHNLSNEGVHFNKILDTQLKQKWQTIYETEHSREEFIKTFGRNYRED